jgi:hypothetical protein
MTIDFHSFKAYSRDIADDAREKYLKYARKCLLDARVHSDGSCPVSLSDVTANNELANGWKVQSGTWRVIEDDPSDGRPGKRWMKRVGGVCVASQASDSAYGSWYFRFVAGSGMEFHLVSDREDETSNFGYTVDYLNTFTVFRLTRRDGAVVTVIDTLSVDLFGNEYECWVTRRFDGLFQVWLKGAAYTTWTLVLEATDTTYSESKYQIIEVSANDEYGGSVSFLGEMIPNEAIKMGILQS